MSSRMQADDFFNAYRVLRESNDAMMTKLEKLSGKPLVGKTAFGTLPAMGVDIVCLAFSVELHIKDVYYALNVEPPHGHNILKLYEGLPQNIQRDIFNQESISENPFNYRGNILSTRIFDIKYTAYDRFIDEIRAISDGFEKWRYSHERKGTLRYNTGFAEAYITALKVTGNNIRKKLSA